MAMWQLKNIIGTMSMEENETGARACPFCGKPPEVWTYDGKEVVECKNESCPMYYEYSGSIFLDTWNNRPIEEQLKKEIASLKASLI